MPRVFAIIVSAGQSKRFGKQDKLLAKLGSQPVIWHTLKAFEDSRHIDTIVLVAGRQNQARLQTIARHFSKVKKITLGGKTRQESSFLGLKFLSARENDLVLFHNGANPLVSQKEIRAVIQAVKKFGAAVVGKPKQSTLKKIGENGLIKKTLARENVWAAQTPQGMNYALALKVFQQATQDHFEGTDDVQLVERIGQPVKMLEANCFNLKITTKNDLVLANLILHKEQQIRVGLGQDSHRFETRPKPLILGGYQISSTGGLKANSDADVILHALCNALSSAIGGNSFSAWADALCRQGITDSQVYLAEIYQKVLKQGFKINNLSVALEAGQPKLEKHLSQIQARLAKILKIKTQQIGLTVTSGEGLTEFGKGQGIQCFCYLSLRK